MYQYHLFFKKKALSINQKVEDTLEIFYHVYLRLTLVSRNKVTLDAVRDLCLSAGSPDVLVVACDLTQESECDLAIQKTVQRFGGKK